MRLSILAVGMITTLTSAAYAQDRTLPAGSEFDISAFQTKPAEIGVATLKKTGHKITVLKMKNGHMMALVPFETYMAFMGGAGPDEMNP